MSVAHREAVRFLRHRRWIAAGTEGPAGAVLDRVRPSWREELDREEALGWAAFKVTGAQW